ncbi:recombination regulator RecX [Shewanella sp. NIFS-20-20]|nr:recombination regulator RecX [Shewanella sp. NIFS-20-20]
MLARRDHSCKEVTDKLLAKGFSGSDIDAVVAEYCASGYLDDERFAQLLLRSHINKGHGPVRIQQAMMLKGIAKSIVSESLAGSDCDWFALARAKATRKYREFGAIDPKEKAKRIRYLLSQGFSYEQVNFALAPPEDYDV